MYTISAAVIGPILTACIAIATVWLTNWHDRHDSHKQRHRALTEVREQLDLIVAWITAFNLASPNTDSQASRVNVIFDLNQIYLQLGQLLKESLDVPVRQRTTFKQLIATMLLREQITTKAGKWARRAYYVTLAWAGFFIGAFPSLISSLTYENVFAAIMATVLGGILPALSCYFFAIRVDKRSRERSAGRSPSIYESLAPARANDTQAELRL
jgi:hypothetical protein